ncbi:MAG: bifunctional 5,10-methylenetetrahydrofolate dehydrogenase/5,10-methenyltetrahydrofolate cyclohydrolase [Bacilli bacterium]|jgi:methylenetetrahydrofolate dehydrogenase (NADP+)/methenyltetrahydrofolate cyclohydrolase|nr:bifunctional 5,10-methylenetetrahydrofolate dehydrogenase/5,10-methenyltetrahydrofolate cyclohydrolase [Bacilli bacterium]
MNVINTKEIIENIKNDINILKTKTPIKEPCVAIVRVGDHGDDITYEKSIVKRFALLNIKTQLNTYQNNVDNNYFINEIIKLNNDHNINGIIVLRPLPTSIDDDMVAKILDDNKDIDGLSYTNIARVFSQENKGIIPCTPQAVMSILEYLKIDLKGKNVTIVGAGMAVGRPLSIIILNERATVTICRSLTSDLISECRKADIIIAAAGVKHLITKEHVKKGAIVIDVGINVIDNKIYGDVDFDNVKLKAQAITPVPGGVGSITPYILAKQLFQNLVNQKK